MTQNEIVKKWNRMTGESVVQALNRRYFEAYYCENAAEATKKALSLIPSSDTVSWGGSMTLDSLGIKQKLVEEGFSVIDRDAANTPEERQVLNRKALLADTFLMSSNAISEDGHLFNIDGAGSRLAALVYGPKNVIIIAGMNKVVHSLEDAVSRVRNIAAPLNHQRFPGNTPCTKTGLCGDCVSTDCICVQMVTTRLSCPAKRIKVILVGENLGL